MSARNKLRRKTLKCFFPDKYSSLTPVLQQLIKTVDDIDEVGLKLKVESLPVQT